MDRPALAGTREGQAGCLVVDPLARRLRVNDRPVQLTPLEYELIWLLMKHAGACLQRRDIISTVWGIDHETGTNFLDVHIHALRRKLKSAGVTQCIHTIRGVGYRLEKPA